MSGEDEIVEKPSGDGPRRRFGVPSVESELADARIISCEEAKLRGVVRRLMDSNASLRAEAIALPVTPTNPSSRGIHVRVFADEAGSFPNHVRWPQPKDYGEAFVDAQRLIGWLKNGGRQATNAPVREFAETQLREVIHDLSDAVRSLGTFAARPRYTRPEISDEPSQWVDPRTDWRIVGIDPTPPAEDAEGAFNNLCSAVGELRDLGSRHERGSAVRFDAAAYKIGIARIAAAAQDLARFAMPDTTFDDGAKTLTDQATSLGAARDQLRRNL